MSVVSAVRRARHFRLVPSRDVPRLLTHLVLVSFAVLMIFPLLWLVSTSLKHPGKQ